MYQDETRIRKEKERTYQQNFLKEGRKIEISLEVLKRKEFFRYLINSENRYSDMSVTEKRHGYLKE